MILPFSLHNKLPFIIGICVLIFFTFFIPGKAFALTTADFQNFYFDPNNRLESCDPSECDNVGAECNNGPSITDNGGCGAPACGQGSSWTKYRVECKNVGGSTPLCEDTLVGIGVVCATGDKCDDGSGGILPGYLRAGLCECGIGVTNKICCSTAGSMANSCVQIAVDNTNPLWEGVCPGGYTGVRCGPGTGFNCDESACGTTSTPPPVGSCTEDVRYCDTNIDRIIHKHSGFWDGTMCVYQYDTEGPCTPSTPPPSGPPPAPDTEKPVCNNSLSVTPASGGAGTSVNINVTVSDNVRVDRLEIFRNRGAESVKLLSTDNPLNQNPFPKSYNWNTTGLPIGLYTIVVNASDPSGNVMNGLTDGCSKTFELTNPTPWVEGTCTAANTFTGCNQVGQSRCTDSGNSTYSNWTSAKGAICNAACTMSPIDRYCDPLGTGIINVTPDPLTKNATCSAWNALNISTTTNGTNGGKAALKAGSAPAPGPCDATGRCVGWADIPGANYSTDGTNNASLTPNPGEPGGNYSFGLFRMSGGSAVELLATDVVNFQATTCGTPAPTPPPGGGGGGGCIIGPVGSGTSYSWSISVYPNSGSGNPIAPTSFTDGTNSQSTFTWNCDPLDDGRCDAVTSSYTYSFGQNITAIFNDGEGHSCSSSYTIPSAPAPRCSADTGQTVNLTVSVYEDPNFIATDWPEMEWKNERADYCYSGGASLTNKPTIAQNTNQSQAVLGEVLQAGTHSCFNNNDCSDLAENSCQTYFCDAWIPFVAGNCQLASNKSRGATCGVSTNGGNKYCDGATPSVCQDNLCLNNAECNDGNNCTNNSCPTTTDPENPGPWACLNTNAPIKTPCGANAAGGNYYCGGETAPDGICYNTLPPAPAKTQYCKTTEPNDCNDGNQCTNELCITSTACARFEDGICVELGQGTCSIGNKLPRISEGVCEQDASGNDLRLCKAVADPSIASKCETPIVACPNKAATPVDTGGNCCGTTNIQGNICNGTCSQITAYTGPINKPIANAFVEIYSDDCALRHTGFTNASGQVTFTVRVGYGERRPSNGAFTRFKWTAKVTPPEGPDKYTSTRGIGLRSHKEKVRISGTDQCQDYGALRYKSHSGPFGTPIINNLQVNECIENSRRYFSDNLYATFGFEKKANATPWIQTTGGDVHSNINISTPGGP